MYRKYLFLVTLISIAFLLVSGCEDDAATSPIPSGSLFPLGIGNSWIYDVEAWKDSILLYRSPDTVMVDTSVIIWGGSEWVKYKGDEGVFWRNGPDGVWRLLYGLDYPSGLAEKYYGFPVAAGDRWHIESDDDSISVVSITETVEVPAGEFDECYFFRIVRTDESRQVSVWIKPGIGILQRNSFEIVDDDTLRKLERLRDY